MGHIPAILPRSDAGSGGADAGGEPGAGEQDREKGDWDSEKEDRIMQKMLIDTNQQVGKMHNLPSLSF